MSSGGGGSDIPPSLPPGAQRRSRTTSGGNSMEPPPPPPQQQRPAPPSILRTARFSPANSALSDNTASRTSSGTSSQGAGGVGGAGGRPRVEKRHSTEGVSSAARSSLRPLPMRRVKTDGADQSQRPGDGGLGVGGAGGRNKSRKLSGSVLNKALVGLKLRSSDSSAASSSLGPTPEEGSYHSARPLLLNKSIGIRGPPGNTVPGAQGGGGGRTSPRPGLDPIHEPSARRKRDGIAYRSGEASPFSAGAGGGTSPVVGVGVSMGVGVVGMGLNDAHSAASSSTDLHTAMASGALHSDTATAASAVAALSRTANYRRYRVGDQVLVCNHQSRWATLVNRYGFPSGEGVTEAERKGPYVYVLATVKKIHFEEDEQYYTVTRADTETDQRADAEWMEPIRTKRGEEAAHRAATEGGLFGKGTAGARSIQQSLLSGGADEAGRPWYARLFRCIIISPFLMMYRCLDNTVGGRYRVARAWTKGQAALLLNGTRPYACRIRTTGINFLVVCGTWYMFIDQARLAFFPPEADYALAVVNTVVWFILLIELFMQVFIRPKGYYDLIASERAFEPATVRHINTFHLVCETISLIIFVPELLCLFTSKYECGDRSGFSLLNASLMSIIGPTRLDAFYGRGYFALVRLRIFGLVRHWRNMWINNTLVSSNKGKNRKHRGYCSTVLVPNGQRVFTIENSEDDLSSKRRQNQSLPDDGSTGTVDGTKKGETSGTVSAAAQRHQDEHLTNASNIGTALMVINSQRSLIILAAIVGLLPVLNTLAVRGGTNVVSYEMVQQLQATNLLVTDARNTSNECDFLADSVNAWLTGLTAVERPLLKSYGIYVLWLQVLPVRCPFQQSNVTSDGVVTGLWCDGSEDETSGYEDTLLELCQVWEGSDASTTIEELADRADIRTGVITVASASGLSNVTYADGTSKEEMFNVTAIYNQQYAVVPTNFASFILQAALLVFVLFGLSVLRVDASRLVLGPLRRMLKIVALYAKNPLAQPKERRKGKKGSVTFDGSDEDSDGDDDSKSDSDDEFSSEGQLGNFETEQLISAVTKITDLLRKCWGVAGAGIISSNLARQKGGLSAIFNPCVPGKCVYALFAFAAIKGFDHQLRALGDDIMILINDVAAVLHGEVFRWGFGDSGQCNKNLGSAFLMVYRIGDMHEVKEKRDKASAVIFKSSTAEKRGIRRRNRYQSTRSGSAMTEGTGGGASRGIRVKRKVNTNATFASLKSLSLSSLPGINAFTDRALIGMLKSYAGIYRDQKLLEWKNDFRLGAGVGAFSVDMIFGMDAGWAVEGAVGSGYKIDATYLSPHVNMASRMMSACKQYGVSILLSQAVEELLSDAARSKLRHLDTVTVKGSSVKQRIFTYDARHKGVDFFLFERSEEQADVDSERYAPTIWNTDQDLRAMRQHVTEDFEHEFNKGRREYLEGRWQSAIKHLKAADEIMVETIMEEGYIDDVMNEIQARRLDGEDAEAEEAHVRNEMGDGPSRCLIGFMEREGGQPPKGWKGFRPLTSK